MSAYVVDPKTINRIVWQLWSDQAGNEVRRWLQRLEWDCNSDEACADIGQAMYNLNINAVGQRYRDCHTPDELPGRIDEAGRLVPYKFTTERCTKIQALKSLQCWLYQCSEGDVPERSKLFQLFEKISRLWCEEIVSGLPEYEDAEWA